MVRVVSTAETSDRSRSGLPASEGRAGATAEGTVRALRRSSRLTVSFERLTHPSSLALDESDYVPVQRASS
jgi:hypothetical protein